MKIIFVCDTVKSMKLYEEHIKDHFKSPRHKGHLADPDFVSGQHNPSCGDKVSFEGTVSNGLVSQIRFDGVGCMISQAAASMLAERVVGMSTDAVRAMTAADMKELIKLDIGPVRLKCVTLSLEALQKGINDYVGSGKTLT